MTVEYIAGMLGAGVLVIVAFVIISILFIDKEPKEEKEDKRVTDCEVCYHAEVCGAKKTFEYAKIQANVINVEGFVSIEVKCLKFSDKK